MDEVRELRAENRHLLNCLLKQQSMPVVGEAMQPVTTPKTSMRQRAAQLEANAWREWQESLDVTKPKTEAV